MRHVGTTRGVTETWIACCDGTTKDQIDASLSALIASFI